MKTKKSIKTRLEHLRGELRGERISAGELCELQSLAAHITPGDVELLEAAGVPEFAAEDDAKKLSFDGQGVIMAGDPGHKRVVCQLKPDFFELAPLFCGAPDLLAACQRAAAWIGCNVFPPEVHHLEELRALHAAIERVKP